MTAALRIGLGWDRHRLAPGRPFVLGGLSIPHDQGPVGHSDGDVLLHAAIDAALGAAGGEDIGTLFPDTDPDFAGARSETLVERALARVAALGCTLLSLDAVLVADAPRIAPHRAALRENLARLFGLPLDAVNVKAKTTEGLGPANAIEATVVVLASRG